MKKFLFSLLISLLSITLYAYDFEVNGIYYNIVSTTDLTCSVTSNPNKYSGNITIPNKVTYNNRELSVVEIEKRAFYKCSSLSSVTIPNQVTTIGEEAFFYCFSLSSITIPNLVTTIGKGAFYYCTNLTTVTIGTSVTTIGEEAFYYCTSLNPLIIPNSVTTIGEKAFYQCTSLTTVVIGTSVPTIEKGCFIGCPIKRCYCDNNEIPYFEDLNYLELGENVSVLNIISAYFCELETLVIHRYVPLTIDSKCFSESHIATLNVFVPTSSLKNYQEADGWKRFWNLQGGAESISILENWSTNILHMEKNKDIVISYIGNGIQISGTERGDQISVFSIDGTLIDNVIANDNEIFIECNSGFNIVKIREKIVKVFVNK